jgi:hypothetical protein
MRQPRNRYGREWEEATPLRLTPGKLMLAARLSGILAPLDQVCGIM